MNVITFHKSRKNRAKFKNFLNDPRVNIIAGDQARKYSSRYICSCFGAIRFECRWRNGIFCLKYREVCESFQAYVTQITPRPLPFISSQLFFRISL